MPKHSGFTLIELLIVITIISLLSIIGLVAYGNFLKNARDSKRQADLKIIQSALEDYHADQLYYPDARPPNPCATYPNGVLVLLCPLKSPDGKRIYLNEIPNDPKNYPPYCYEALTCDFSSSPPKCQSYKLSTFLEGGSAATISGCSLVNAFNLQVTRP